MKVHREIEQVVVEPVLLVVMVLALELVVVLVELV